MTPFLYLTESDVMQTLSMQEAIEIAARGLKADAQGQVEGNKFYLHVDRSRFIKPFAGYLQGEPYAFVKIFSFFPITQENGGQSTTGSQVLLYEVEHGNLVCLMEANWATGLKTGASTALTAKALANPDSAHCVIFGAGLQGEMHLRALSTRFELISTEIIDIDLAKADALARRMRDELGTRVQTGTLEDRQRSVIEADIIVTVTTGNQALVERAWLKPGVFLARLGSYQEISLDVITQADKVIVDRWKYVSTRIPELKELISNGHYKKEDIHAEWLDIVAGKVVGRETPEEVIVYIALGIWGEYAALLPEIYRRAQALGLGSNI